MKPQKRRIKTWLVRGEVGIVWDMCDDTAIGQVKSGRRICGSQVPRIFELAREQAENYSKRIPGDCGLDLHGIWAMIGTNDDSLVEVRMQ
jgi:hypothetical protein